MRVALDDDHLHSVVSDSFQAKLFTSIKVTATQSQVQFACAVAWLRASRVLLGQSATRFMY